MHQPTATPTTRSAHPRPWRFLLLVTVLSVPFLVAGSLFDGVVLGGLHLPMSALMAVVPGIAALLLVGRDEGREGVWRMLRRLGDVRRAGAVRLALAALLPQAVAALAWLAGLALGHTPPPVAVSPLGVLAMATLFLVSAAFEELGWTGHATPPLVRRFGALGAGLLLGAACGLWHLVPLLQAGHDAVWIAGWAIGTVAARVVMVQLWDWRDGRPGESLALAVVLHASLNVAAALLPGGQEGTTQLLHGPASAVVAVVTTMLVSWRSRR
ncbi:CPBP family glutamic-type intramembrane protease [Agrococcus baldri]|uniref:CAAX prenyl protease 2/Lysostaphin resistance protein A-like domain-containing protein n=1 Tax=Agrococcus baldri TaxID=153730 RepID=A0AA87URY8_9MICO|nr:CPBP family glutamic-type intramembrane protease [Agrococcus baldri]GEK79890.1 hypothetical protein ABA31_12410 [Agrococcus baldri]